MRCSASAQIVVLRRLEGVSLRAIPRLLEIIEIQGCIVTIDAMGTQKEIAQEIINQGGDYILSLKGNQGNIHQDVQQLFDWGFKTQFKNIPHEAHKTINKGTRNSVSLVVV